MPPDHRVDAVLDVARVVHGGAAERRQRAEPVRGLRPEVRDPQPFRVDRSVGVVQVQQVLGPPFGRGQHVQPVVPAVRQRDQLAAAAQVVAAGAAAGNRTARRRPRRSGPARQFVGGKGVGPDVEAPPPRSVTGVSPRCRSARADRAAGPAAVSWLVMSASGQLVEGWFGARPRPPEREGAGSIPVAGHQVTRRAGRGGPGEHPDRAPPGARAGRPGRQQAGRSTADGGRHRRRAGRRWHRSRMRSRDQ